MQAVRRFTIGDGRCRWRAHEPDVFFASREERAVEGRLVELRSTRGGRGRPPCRRCRRYGVSPSVTAGVAGELMSLMSSLLRARNARWRGGSSSYARRGEEGDVLPVEDAGGTAFHHR